LPIYASAAIYVAESQGKIVAAASDGAYVAAADFQSHAAIYAV